ncbi:MAG: MBL fold metallo-hydrolase [Erysipelotrichaceae bacterium]|nr:MBL fold metallo-hydrolase [Erysipelotrichaceae bacterium]
MRFALLASGSKGNCFLFYDENTRLMIDCGTTVKYLKSCFESLNTKISDLDAVLITHNHSDHIAQIRKFADRPVYSPVQISGIETIPVRPGGKFHVEHVTVTPLALSHDAGPTVGYILETWQNKLVYITDTGYLKDEYLPLIRGADYYILESNHDVEMLMGTSRPQYLKARIFSDTGHLCNEDCAAILEKAVTQRTRAVILAHISQEANTREAALAVSAECLRHCPGVRKDLIIAAAGQYEMIKGGDWGEETDYGSCCCTAGMEHLADLQPSEIIGS